MDRLQAMYALVRIVDTGSFSHAAVQLNLSTSAITRIIGALEQHLNAQLLNRSTRRVAPTQLGLEYLTGCRDIIARLEELETRVNDMTGEPDGTLHIACKDSFVGMLGKLAARYRMEQPNVELDVTTFDETVDLMEGRFDLCISDDRMSTPAHFVARPLRTFDYILVATERYLLRHGIPCDVGDLSRHTLLTTVPRDNLPWEIADASGNRHFATEAALRSRSEEMIRGTALSHGGIAVLPEPIVADDIASGRLRRLLENCVVDRGRHEVTMFYASRKHMPVRSRNFVDFVLEQCRPADYARSM
jgi:DNA-binding transcriptional LysR family regulator